MPFIAAFLLVAVNQSIRFDLVLAASCPLKSLLRIFTGWKTKSTCSPTLTPNSAMATQPSDDDETHDQPLIEEPNTDDHAQRKRSRVLSHLDEDSGPTAAAINSTAETVVEREATPVDEHDSPAPEANRASNTTGPIKRRKLNVDIAEMVDQDETTRESTRTRSNSGSKDDSSTTTDEPEDDDVEEDEDEDEEEEEEEQDDESDDTKLPPTRNHYLNLRQRELGIFPRPRERATCRAFHTNTIASRNLVQRMKVSHTLDAHNGCVNALAFNRIGKSVNGTNEFDHRLC